MCDGLWSPLGVHVSLQVDALTTWRFYFVDGQDQFGRETPLADIPSRFLIFEYN
jgi:hypothetical protein